MAKTVLIIDDDPEFTASTRDLLEAEDYRVANLPGVSGAIDRIKEVRPDVILLDVMMESADSGLNTAKALRDDPETASIPVILITGISKAEHLLPSYAPNEAWPNVKTSFEKPVDPEALIRKLREIL